jgi:hypothetical protein
MPSASDRVYLTNAYSLIYALHAFYRENDENQGGAIIEIDSRRLNRELFVADEDFIAKQLSHQFPETMTCLDEFKRLQQESISAADDMSADEKFDVAKMSLEKYGTIAYRDCIPRNAITRIFLIPMSVFAALRYKQFPDSRQWEIHPTSSDRCQMNLHKSISAAIIRAGESGQYGISRCEL